jgi:hypothetical protein
MMNSLMSSDTPLKSARSIRRHANVSALSPRGDICDLMDQLYDDAIEMSDCSSYKAYTWKAIDNLCNVFILVATGVMTALGAAGAIISGASTNAAGANATMNIPTSANDSISYAIVAISAVSFIVKGLMMYFLFRKRAISAKNNAVKLKKIARSVKLIKNSRLNNQEILRKLDLLYAEIDQIELNAFAEDMGDNIGMAPNSSTNNIQSKKAPLGVSNASISEKINVIADTLDVITDINGGDVKITL